MAGGRLRFYLLAVLVALHVVAVASANAAANTLNQDTIENCAALLEDWEQPVPVGGSAETEVKQGEGFNTIEDATDAGDTHPETTALEPVPLMQRLISAACPVQTDLLAQHSWANLLVREPQELMLLDLRGFYAFSNYSESRNTLDVLDDSKLGGILNGLELPQPEPVSLWRRILDWLKQWWQPEQEQEFDWLERFIPSETTLKLIMFVSIALVVVGAIGIVVVELRAGLVHRRRAYHSQWSDDFFEATSGLSLDDVQAAPLAEQPGLLLRWLLEQLQASGLLGLRASLTHRDISAATANLDQHDSVARVSSAAERATFGGWVPSRQEMQELLELGKTVPAGLPERKK